VASNVLSLPVVQTVPSCYTCIHARMGSLTFCTAVNETIVDERVAQDCEDFEHGDQED
jgi:hypothetical protein